MDSRSRFLRFQPRPLWILASISLCVALGHPGSADAVHNIRNVTWSEPHRTQSFPTTTRVGVSFDADLSVIETMYGTTSFSIATQNANGYSERLIDYTVGPWSEAPDAGTTIHVALEVEIYCDQAGAWLRASARRAQVRYLHPLKGQVEHKAWRAGSTADRAEVWDGFGLRVLDEDGNAADIALDSSALACERIESIDASIGVYFDRQGTQCSGTIGPGEIATIYVVAHYGPLVDGIAGAEFRFVGLPSTWEVSPVPNPDVLAIGDPFGDGAVMGFVCPRPEARRYVLYEVLVRAGDVQEDVVFTLERRAPPINESLDCPIFVSCDEPRYSQSCVETVPCFINSTKATPCDETVVSVTSTTWSVVKHMYR